MGSTTTHKQEGSAQHAQNCPPTPSQAASPSTRNGPLTVCDPQAGPDGSAALRSPTLCAGGSQDIEHPEKEEGEHKGGKNS